VISRLTALLGVLAFLSACGGSSGGSSSPPPPPPPPANTAPVVDAGADATIQLPEDSVALDATVTDDGLPSNTLTYTWSVSSGPDGATFADANAEDTTVTFVNAGTYVLQLTASDSALEGSDTVQVTVDPAVAGNNPPVADDQSVSTPEDTALPITLTGSDPDGDAITFALGTGPANGTLSGTAPNVTYTPSAGFNGADSFTFTVNDGTVDSAAATVSISVGAVNDAPTADDQSVSTDEDTPLPITLTGSDPDGDALTFAIGTQPTNGTLSGVAPNVTYTPNAEFNGADSFTFTVNDGTVDSAAATVSITVNAVNDAPTADDQSVTTNQDVAFDITLTGSDPDGDALTFAIVTAPTNGTLSGELDGDELVTYTPNGGFTGSDSFTFTVNDGTVDSAEATVSITVCAACAYWQFNTGNGTTAIDTWGDTDGTVVDSTAPSWTDGVTGPGGTDFALDFDGSGDYVDMVDATALDITGTSLTLTAWIYPRDGGANGGSRVISKLNNAGNGDVYAMYTDSYRLRFRTIDGVDMISEHIIELNEWVHVAMVYDGTDQRIYINGVLDPATPQLENRPIPSSNSPLQLGRRGDNTRFFNGIIDEAQVYDRALTDTEVAAIAAALTPVNPSPASLTFTDITAAAGTEGLTSGGHGVMFAEANNDSLVDYYLTNNVEGTADWPELYFENTDGTAFNSVAAARGIEDNDDDGGSHGAVWADLDNDGDYDLVNGSTWSQANPSGGNPAPDNVFENDGNATFTDVTPAIMQAVNVPIETRGITAFDWDGDGDLDLFGVSGSDFPEDNVSFQNNFDGGTGTAFDFTAHVGGDLSTAIGMQGVTDTDYDGDGDVDVFAANRNGDFAILDNDGFGVFTQILPATLGITDGAGDGITTADVDNDLDLDLLLVSNGTAELYLRNEPAGTYSPAQSFNDIEGYMGGFADLDNDGDLDLVFAGDERVFLNDGTGSFVSGPSIPVSGIADPRAVAFADIEGDGDMDFAIAAKDSRNWLLRNNIDADAGNWLRVELVSPQCQAGAFGAKVVVRPAGDSVTVTGMREAKGNAGYLGQDDPVLHFGLGAEASVDVTVTWVDGTQAQALAQAANQRILVDACIP